MSATISPTRPSPAPMRPFHFPAARRFHLDSGLEVVLCDLPGRALAAAKLVLEAGPPAEPEGQGGVAALAAQTVTAGTTRFDADGVAAVIEGLGAELGASVDRDVFTFSLTLAATRLEDGLELLAHVVREPTFPDEEVDRARTARVAALDRRALDPGGRAWLELVHSIYTPRSTWWREVGGEPDTVRVLDRDLVEAYYRTFATPGSGTLFVVGALDAGIDGRIEEMFGPWRSPEPTRAQLIEEDAVKRSELRLVHRPGAVQSSLAMGHVGVSRQIPDLHAASILLNKLGAGMGSRINYRLREEKGYTYAAGFSVDAGRGAGPMAALTSVETDVTADAVATVIEEVRLMKDKGVTQQELEDEVEEFVGRFPVAYQTADGICGALANIHTWGLPADWLDTYRERLSALTLAEVNATARYLRPDRMISVVVGDADRIAEPLRALNLAPVTVIRDEALA
jgi:predicted Zn-dependent peptidase